MRVTWTCTRKHSPSFIKKHTTRKLSLIKLNKRRKKESSTFAYLCCKTCAPLKKIRVHGSVTSRRTSAKGPPSRRSNHYSSWTTPACNNLQRHFNHKHLREKIFRDNIFGLKWTEICCCLENNCQENDQEKCAKQLGALQDPFKNVIESNQHREHWNKRNPS